MAEKMAVMAMTTSIRDAAAFSSALSILGYQEPILVEICTKTKQGSCRQVGSSNIQIYRLFYGLRKPYE
jgi:hypothetical protein